MKRTERSVIPLRTRSLVSRDTSFDFANPQRPSSTQPPAGPQDSGTPLELPTMRAVKARWAGLDGDDAACCVCGDAEAGRGNAIVFCDGRSCHVAVHQRCYGLDKLPRGRWLCDACRDGLDSAAVNCACCPVVGGAVRKVSPGVTAGPVGDCSAERGRGVRGRMDRSLCASRLVWLQAMA